MTTTKKSALGRGLDALISTDLVRTSGSSSISEVPLEQIYPNQDQPRKEFDPESLEELADSIREVGIIQPVTLRKKSDKEYQIIAGERRFRAAAMAGLKTIPAYIRTASDENLMEMALIENIQREDLNSIEVALACQHLIEVYNMTQEQLSARIGKKRATIANYIRLLKLPAEIQVALKNREIDMGHARALLAIDDPVKQLHLFHELKQHGYSVRMVEKKVKQINDDTKTAKTDKKKISDSLAPLEKQLSSYFDSNVKLKYNTNGKGSINIPFKNESDLTRIIKLFDGIRK
ncbi:MAG TPA: ParB/RepB/Spo0J family partition protein [Bacteroidaceae bacterium]|jgi:ParB family chromosome partitioning protein|nr:ParB/RepB/Spo0J family partition protein [Bacteroidales bacterium]HPX98374.1 ParB/RepB/Spo0J family partition protein [Bacteroidaceae bacterium]